MTEDAYRSAVLLAAQKCFNDYRRFHRGKELEGYFEEWVKGNLERPNEKFVEEIWREFIELCIENGR